MKAKIVNLTKEVGDLQEKLLQTVKDKNILCEKLTQKLDATELELSHLKIDYQTLLLENERLANRQETSRQEPNRQETSRQEQSPPPLARKPSVIKKLRGGKA